MMLAYVLAFGNASRCPPQNVVGYAALIITIFAAPQEHQWHKA
jgi:hypothetical protein